MQRPHVHVKDGRIINQPFNSKRRSDYAESLQKKTERTLSPSTNLLTLLILSLRLWHPPAIFKEPRDLRPILLHDHFRPEMTSPRQQFQFCPGPFGESLN
jgi:hypothetical protein